MYGDIPSEICKLFSQIITGNFLCFVLCELCHNDIRFLLANLHRAFPDEQCNEMLTMGEQPVRQIK